MRKFIYHSAFFLAASSIKFAKYSLALNTFFHRGSILRLSSSSKATMEAPVARQSGAAIVACFPEDYEKLLQEKFLKFRTLMQDHYSGAVEIHESPREHYRMRANFNIWRDNPRDFSASDGMYYAMYGEDKKKPLEIIEFPRGTVKMNSLMSQLIDTVRSNQVLGRSLFEVRFVTTLSDEAVVVLLYKKPVPETWQDQAEMLSKTLGAKIVGRSRKLKHVAGGSEIIRESLQVNSQTIHYFQTEGAFSQPNAKVCEKMLEWSLRMTSDSHDHDLLELYCGGGTFTAALAKNFRNVLATEISKASVELAVQTFGANNINNIKIARLSSEEFTQAYSGQRRFNRLEEAAISFTDYNIRTVFVDPPRAGLDTDTCALLSRFQKIVYVSCNPVTLARDVDVLAPTHEVVSAAVFDQFPYTDHLESGVVLVRRSADQVIEEAKTKEEVKGNGSGSVLGKRTLECSRQGDDEVDGTAEETT